MELLLLAFLFGLVNCIPQGSRTCNVSDSAKFECGYYGIDEAGCTTRGCCWTPCDDCDDPWCYLPQEYMTDECAVCLENRVDCGYYGIQKEECLRKGCCWQPYGIDSRQPWCFYQDERPQTTPEPILVLKKEKSSQTWWQEVMKKPEKLSVYSKHKKLIE